MALNKRKVLFVVTLLVLAAGAAAVYLQPDPQPTPTPQSQPDQSQQTAFDKNRFSIEDPASPWVIINKQRPLPSQYMPQDLTNIGGASMREEAAVATKELLAAAEGQSVKLKMISGFRSYSAQQNVYNNYVQKDGQAAADTYSARPGHSEHQTGLAADLGNSDGTCDLEICFAKSAGGRWLAENAHKYGFIIRYTEGKTSTTGYQYEPWHIRYVGPELARELTAKEQTMEEFFGLPPAADY